MPHWESPAGLKEVEDKMLKKVLALAVKELGPILHHQSANTELSYLYITIRCPKQVKFAQKK